MQKEAYEQLKSGLKKLKEIYLNSYKSSTQTLILGTHLFSFEVVTCRS